MFAGNVEDVAVGVFDAITCVDVEVKASGSQRSVGS